MGYMNVQQIYGSTTEDVLRAIGTAVDLLDRIGTAGAKQQAAQVQVDGQRLAELTAQAGGSLNAAMLTNPEAKLLYARLQRSQAGNANDKDSFWGKLGGAFGANSYADRNAVAKRLGINPDSPEYQKDLQDLGYAPNEKISGNDQAILASYQAARMDPSANAYVNAGKLQFGDKDFANQDTNPQFEPMAGHNGTLFGGKRVAPEVVPPVAQAAPSATPAWQPRTGVSTLPGSVGMPQGAAPIQEPGAAGINQAHPLLTSPYATTPPAAVPGPAERPTFASRVQGGPAAIPVQPTPPPVSRPAMMGPAAVPTAATPSAPAVGVAPAANQAQVHSALATPGPVSSADRVRANNRAIVVGNMPEGEARYGTPEYQAEAQAKLPAATQTLISKLGIPATDKEAQTAAMSLTEGIAEDNPEALAYYGAKLLPYMNGRQWKKDSKPLTAEEAGVLWLSARAGEAQHMIIEGSKYSPQNPTIYLAWNGAKLEEGGDAVNNTDMGRTNVDYTEEKPKLGEPPSTKHNGNDLLYKGAGPSAVGGRASYTTLGADAALAQRAAIKMAKNEPLTPEEQAAYNQQTRKEGYVSIPNDAKVYDPRTGQAMLFGQLRKVNPQAAEEMNRQAQAVRGVNTSNDARLSDAYTINALPGVAQRYKDSAAQLSQAEKQASGMANAQLAADAKNAYTTALQENAKLKNELDIKKEENDKAQAEALLKYKQDALAQAKQLAADKNKAAIDTANIRAAAAGKTGSSNQAAAASKRLTAANQQVEDAYKAYSAMLGKRKNFADEQKYNDAVAALEAVWQTRQRKFDKIAQEYDLLTTPPTDATASSAPSTSSATPSATAVPTWKSPAAKVLAGLGLSLSGGQAPATTKSGYDWKSKYGAVTGK